MGDLQRQPLDIMVPSEKEKNKHCKEATKMKINQESILCYNYKLEVPQRREFA